VEYNDQLAQAYFWEGRSLHQLGEFKKALVAYNATINLDDGLGEAYLYRGAINVQLRRSKNACKDFKLAANLNVGEAETALRTYCK